MTRESELLEHIYERSGDLTSSGVEVGPGDDAAVVHLGGRAVLSVDQLVAGRHFDPSSTSIDQIARKAIARSVSDLAAIGAQPRCALAAACLPAQYAHADELFDRMAHWARHWSCPLVGGDIATGDGPLVLSVTSLGICDSSRGPVLRSEAQAGDEIWVTGSLGGSLASGRNLSFEPRLAEASMLCQTLGGSLGAMIDLSDGLGRDGGRVARASGVRVEIHVRSLPMHDGVDDWKQAVGEGEDYELLLTARAGSVAPELIARLSTPITKIGLVSRGSGCVGLDASGAPRDIAEMGWDHGS